jgi:hypothetical protein
VAGRGCVRMRSPQPNSRALASLISTHLNPFGTGWHTMLDTEGQGRMAGEFDSLVPVPPIVAVVNLSRQPRGSGS